MVELDWANLSFKARPTNALVVSYYRNGHWSVPEVTANFNLTLSSFAGALHYASACIEGLKAFRGIDVVLDAHKHTIEPGAYFKDKDNNDALCSFLILTIICSFRSGI